MFTIQSFQDGEWFTEQFEDGQKMIYYSLYCAELTAKSFVDKMIKIMEVER